MKTLHLYLLRQVLVSLLMTVAVFTFVLLLGNVLKEVLSLLVSQRVGLGTVATAVGLLIPYVLVFALPMGMLTATLLTFGRLSADHELTAIRASGISLMALISPVLLLSVLLSLACAAVNMHFAPRCRVAYKELIYRSAMANVESLMQEKVHITQFPPFVISFDKVQGSQLTGIWLYQMDDAGTNLLSTTHATSGSFNVDQTNKTIHLVLKEGWRIGAVEGEEKTPFYTGEWSVDLVWQEKARRPPSLSEATFLELREKRARLFGFTARPAGNTPAAETKAALSKELFRRFLSQIDVQMQAQLAFSFACIGFTLIGIPLGIRAHRRETSVGIAIALILVLVYYSFLILGQSLDNKPQYYPWLIVWIPNLIFQVAGLLMLRKANRGF